MKSRLFFIIIFLSLATFAQDSAIYVSDAGNWSNPPWQILKYDLDGQNPEIFIYEELAWPQDILFIEEDQEVLISNLNSGKITRYNGLTGAYINDFITGLAGPTRMKIGPDSLLYILQWNGTGMVKRYTLDGVYVDDFTSVGVPQSIGLDWDTDTNLYVSSYNGKLVRKFDVNGLDQGVFIDSNLLGPTNIWFDATGDLLVADYNGTSVKRFDATGNYLGEFLTGLGQSEGVAFLANGTILVGKGTNGSVRQYAANGTYIGDKVTSGAGGLIRPNAVVVRDESNLQLPDLDDAGITVATLPDSAFEIRISNPGKYTLIVTDATGKAVHTTLFEERTIWNAQEFPAGGYFLSVFREGSRLSTKKLIVN